MFIREEMIKRKEQRYRLSEPVQYEMRQHNRLGGCVAHDVSDHGMKLEIDEFLPVNSPLTIQFKLFNMSKMFDLVGRVAWTKRIPYSDRYYAGLEFSNPSQELKSGIQEFMKIRSRQYK